MTSKLTLSALILFVAISLFSCGKKESGIDPNLSPEEIKTLAKEAYLYGFPMVDNSRIQYAYFVDETNPEYKGTMNILKSSSKVFTPEDKAVQTPNSDTPYSFVGLDLRVEPLVFSNPSIDANRYWSLQLIDLYTHNFEYLGSRTSGNEAGNFLIAGPNWTGDTPEGITRVIRCETELAFGLIRTQLFNEADLPNVAQIQSNYKVMPLSAFLGQEAPPAAPVLDFPKPLSPEEQRTSLEFFNHLNYGLQFCPTHSSEVELMDRFAKINIGAGKTFDSADFSPEQLQAVKDGMKLAWEEFEEGKKQLNAGKISSGDAFGSREFLKNNYFYRMMGAVLGIYGNSRDEALYPLYFVDSEGSPLVGSNKYVLRFEPGGLPPAKFFWSLTMYEQPASLLVANPINRYLLNSTLMDQFKLDDDQGLTFYIQHESPGEDLESNWLPAPEGPFSVVMRIYGPKEEVFNGTWKQPAIVKK